MPESDPSRYRMVNAEVFYSSAPTVMLAGADLDFLKSQAADTPRERARLCAHPDPGANVHEMFIVHRRGAYVRPHRHVGRSESLMVLSGTARVFFFADDGRIETSVAMGPNGSDRPFYYRMPQGQWHSLVIESAEFVFYEAVEGPFDPSRTEFPGWAPDGSDTRTAQAYMDRLEDMARSC